jgi:hypothetical protein
VTSGQITGFDALALPVHPAGKPGASYEEFGQQKTSFASKVAPGKKAVG